MGPSSSSNSNSRKKALRMGNALCSAMGDKEKEKDEKKEEEATTLLSQDPKAVRHFSSQYGGSGPGRQAYKADNVACGNTTHPFYGDDPRAYVPREYGTWWRDCPSGRVFKSSFR